MCIFLCDYYAESLLNMQVGLNALMRESTLASRLRDARKARELTQVQLSKLSGVRQSDISKIERGDTQRTTSAVELAQALQCDPVWLATGDGEMRVNAPPSVEVEPVQGGLGVPLISWVQAGNWSELSDPYLVGEAEDWLPCPVRHGPRTYCVRVRGDSMFNPGGRPSYADGDIIFVDPDRDAKTGDRVIVRLDDQQEATFKQLLIEDGRKLLKALNPEWSPRYIEINGNATITGVVIGKWVPE
jgi:SOS-response transcriptional repressor LexA